MNIKSLLLGSAAALAAVSGAQAADAIIAAEPEPMEYVRVCDAFGTGYFYIPGTETCLKVGGYVRFEVQYDEDFGGDEWNARTRGYVSFDARSDTELGALQSFIAIRTWAEGDNEFNELELDEAYIKLGGFKAGYGYNYWDIGLSGETDALGSNRLNMIGYEWVGDAFTVGVFVDELGDNALYANSEVGIEGQVGFALGAAKAQILGGYDFAAEDGAVRGIVTADVGPGTLGIAGVWSSGFNSYYAASEWTVAAEYAFAVSDRFKLTPGFQYFWDTNLDAAGSDDAWRAGVTLDYKIVEGLTSKVSVQYQDDEATDDDEWFGFVRLQRSF
jgi:hypothetical protein